LIPKVTRTYITNATGWPNEAMIHSIPAFPKEGCFLPATFDANNSSLKDLNKALQHVRDTSKLVVQTTTAAVRYFSVRSNVVLETIFPVTILFTRSDEPDCKYASVN
jgi:hypothetical protein